MPGRHERPNEGINWGLVAGGAVATVLSLVYSRKRKNQKTKSAAQDDIICSTSSSSDRGNEEHSPQAGSRDAIRRLRHQLKNRDEMIMEMQRQLDTHIIFQANCQHNKEPEQLNLQRAKHLEAELIGIRAMACEMASLLEVSERDRLRLHHAVSQLQRKLVYQAKELHTMKAMYMAEQQCHHHRYGDEQGSCSSSMDKSFLQVEESPGSYWEEDNSVRIDEGSPSVLIGSPTIPGSRQSLDVAGMVGARRYLFPISSSSDDSLEEEQVTEEQVYSSDQPEQQENQVEEEHTTSLQEQEPIIISSSSPEEEQQTDEPELDRQESSGELDEMLDDTLDDLVKVVIN